jgi:hypothetical protein
MKTQLCAAASILLAAVSEGKDVPSPDGQFAVRAEAGISLVDSRGDQILTLIPDTTGDAKIEVAWSPDSKHVVVVENGNRDSDIVAAWKDEVWHKTIELYSDETKTIQAQQVRLYGRLVGEHQKFAGWISSSEETVIDEVTFSSGARYHYGYTLVFGPVSGRLDRGGYEEGELIGKDYHSL